MLIAYLLISGAILVYLIKGTEIWYRVCKKVWNMPQYKEQPKTFKCLSALSVWPIIVCMWPAANLK